MHQAADFEPSTDDKIKYLRFLIQGQVSIGQVTVPIGMTVSQLYEEFFCSWNQGMIRPGLQMTREEKPTHFVFRLTYAKDNLLEIGPYEQVSLCCANSFYGLPIRSPVAGVQYLPNLPFRPSSRGRDDHRALAWLGQDLLLYIVTTPPCDSGAG